MTPVDTPAITEFTVRVPDAHLADLRQRGGHFPMLEAPVLFVDELRAFFADPSLTRRETPHPGRDTRDSRRPSAATREEGAR